MKDLRAVMTWGLGALLLSGCSFLSRGSRLSSPSEIQRGDSVDGKVIPVNVATDHEPRVANPPAQTIRFDGREIVLGTTETRQLATDEFCNELSTLLAQEKRLSAAKLIGKHPAVAEQALWERSGDPASEQLVGFLAEVVSRDLPPAGSWQGLLASLIENPVDGGAYRQARAEFIRQLKTTDPASQAAEQLRAMAQRLNHPLAMIDALRLLALREYLSGRNVGAESLFMQAARIAEQQGDPARAAELWLMIARSANRSSRPGEAQEAWQNAIKGRVIALSTSTHRPLNVHFWLQAEEQRVDDTPWPPQTVEALLRPHRQRWCPLSRQSLPEFVLWCAIAGAQYDAGQPQLALVNYKKAEAFAEGDQLMWLRIAQSGCLSALGQSHAAIALLSGPASSKNPAVAIASTAAIGSSKLQAGAHRQGWQLLTKALTDPRMPQWGMRMEAEADLALAQLIIGDTDEGLVALHLVQEQFRQQGDQNALLQALENELHVLKLEGRSEAVKRVQSQIRDLEQTSLASLIGV